MVGIWVLIFISFIPHCTTHKKKHIVHALQMRYRNWVHYFLGVNIIRAEQIPHRVQGGLEVLHCWWSRRRRKGPTCKTKPVCLSFTGLLANSCWIIYADHLHVCSVVLWATASSLQPTSEPTTSQV